MSLLRLTITTAGVGLLLAALTACGGGSAEDTRQQIAAADSLGQQVDQAHETVDAAAQRVSSLRAGLSAAEDHVAQFVDASSVALLDRTQDIADPPSGKVALRFAFVYPQGPLPGDGLQIHETIPEVSTVWAMESLPKGEAVPVGDSLADATLFLEPGETTAVTLVYNNPTSQEVGWLALPHQETPGSMQTNTWLTCFCLSFIWSAPAEGSWYRVIGVRISPDTPPGSKIDATWTILTDPTVFPTS